MIRIFSTFAMAAWTGFHAVSAAVVFAPTPAALLLSAGHAAVALLCLWVAAGFQSRRPCPTRDAAGLAAIGVGLALAAASHAIGVGSEAPGAYAAAVALTLVGFAFDRRVGLEEDDEEVDHDAFMQEVARLGSRMAQERSESAGARPR